jgi:uncharacterized protein (DUF305 family)
MSAARTRAASASLLTALIIAACGGPTAAGREPNPRPSTGSIAITEFEALYRARLERARQRYTEADVHFMTGMIGHHAQALVMAQLAPTNGASPAIQTLAARILNAQQDEIITMQQWLRERGQPVPEVHLGGTEHMVHGADHAPQMPGMLTPEQLRILEQARGLEFDRLFLTYMIQHHRGAVIMVRELVGTDGAGQDEAVFKFASDVQVDQTTEIARMELMLSALPIPGRAP